MILHQFSVCSEMRDAVTCVQYISAHTNLYQDFTTGIQQTCLMLSFICREPLDMSHIIATKVSADIRIGLT